MATFDFFYDLASPYSYLASTQLDRLCAATGATAALYPVTLGGLRKGLATTMPSAAQLRYMAQDVARWAERYGAPFRLPDSFPARGVQGLRCCVAAELAGHGPAAMAALFRAHWAENRDLADPAAVAAALTAAGLDGEGLVARSAEQAVKDRLRQNTDLALMRGVFGVPTFFVGEHSFWGNDRLDFVEQELRRLGS